MAAAELASGGARVDIYDGLAELPHYDQGIDKSPPAVIADLRERIWHAEEAGRLSEDRAPESILQLMRTASNGLFV